MKEMLRVSRKGGPEYRASIPVRPRGDRWFHRLLHSIELSDSLISRAFFISLILIISICIFAILIPEQATLFASVFALALLGDVVLLIVLPLRRISFGPFTDQLIVINVPRGFVSVVSAGVAVFFPFVGFTIFVLGQSLGTFVYVYGMLYEPGRISITKREIGSLKISNGFTFVHLSDLHIERITRRDEQAIAFIESEVPDFVFLTGDYLNLSNILDAKAQEELGKFLRRLKPRYGIFASMGSPPVDHRPTIQDILENAGVTVLRDEAVEIQIPDGDRLNILGVDCDHRQRLDSQVTSHLMQDVNPELFTILLFHSPEIMPTVRDLSVDVYLCGHTHGGQVRAPLYGALITSSVTGKTYESGSYVENGTNLYVSRGVGLEGRAAPRIRLLCLPEVIHWTVQATSRTGKQSK